MPRNRPDRRAERRPPPAASPPVLASVLADAVRLHQAGHLAEARALYDGVLAWQPRNADASHLRGVVAHQEGEHARALVFVRRAIAANSRSASYHNTLGTILLAMAQPAVAMSAFRRALSLDPGYAEAHSNLGNALMMAGRPGDAEACYRQALAVQPDYAPAHNNLGSALRRLGRLADAEEAYKAAVRLQPGYAGALANLGRVRHERGDIEGALASCEAALAADPENAEAHANRALALLALGRFTEGWSEYEWRWRTEGFAAARRSFTVPAWDGSPLSGRAIFVHAEQGLGSAIQFVRLLPLLKAGGGSVVLECQPPLRRLFSVLTSGDPAPVAALVGHGDDLPAFDVHVPLLSLPNRLGIDLDTIPNTVPYLAVDPTLSALWAARLAALPRPRVGLAWAGNPRHDNDRNRSMPGLQLRPLLSRTDVAFVNLQLGAAAQACFDLDRGRLFDPTPDIADFADTAAIIANLDLVVSVDTAVAHLGGALAQPVWLMLPFVAEWRWMQQRADSPWYPTMRLFRQPRAGDWEAVVAEIAAALADFVQAGSGP